MLHICNLIAAIKCGRPDTVANCVNSGIQTNFGDVINYTCLSGYWMQRNVYSKSSTCGIKGWSSKLQCQGNAHVHSGFHSLNQNIYSDHFMGSVSCIMSFTNGYRIIESFILRLWPSIYAQFQVG